MFCVVHASIVKVMEANVCRAETALPNFVLGTAPKPRSAAAGSVVDVIAGPPAIADAAVLDEDREHVGAERLLIHRAPESLLQLIKDGGAVDSP